MGGGRFANDETYVTLQRAGLAVPPCRYHVNCALKVRPSRIALRSFVVRLEVWMAGLPCPFGKGAYDGLARTFKLMSNGWKGRQASRRHIRIDREDDN